MAASSSTASRARTGLALVIALFIAGTVALVIRYRDSFVVKRSPSLHPSKRGLIFHDRLRAHDDWLVVCLAPHPVCHVIDSDGEEVGRISGQMVSRFPGGGFAIADIVDFLPKPGAKKPDQGLIRADERGAALWKNRLNLHHDFAVDPDRREIFALTQTLETSGGKSVLVDGIKGYSQDGGEIFSWRADEHLPELTKVCGRPIVPYYHPGVQHTILTHLNSIQVLPSNAAYLGESLRHSFKPGNLLIASGYCAFIAVIDRETKSIVWSYRPPSTVGRADRQVHSARLLGDGRILFFQNNGIDDPEDLKHPFSDVVEIDPRDFSTRWSYRADVPGAFFAHHFGSVLRLENDDTLIAHINRGNPGGVFEVDRAGRVVWEWVNPYPADVYWIGVWPKGSLPSSVEAP